MSWWRGIAGEADGATSTFRRHCLWGAVIIGSWLAWQPAAEAAIVKGVTEIVSGILQIPFSTLAGTFQGPPILGTVMGALNGLLGGTSLVAHGALELAVSGLSIAKTVAPYVLPFLF